MHRSVFLTVALLVAGCQDSTGASDCETEVRCVEECGQPVALTACACPDGLKELSVCIPGGQYLLDRTDEPCGTDGLTVDSAFAELRPGYSATLHYADGTDTSLDLEVTLQSGSFACDPPPAGGAGYAVLASATVAFRTGDGRLDQDLDAVLAADGSTMMFNASGDPYAPAVLGLRGVSGVPEELLITGELIGDRTTGTVDVTLGTGACQPDAGTCSPVVAPVASW